MPEPVVAASPSGGPTDQLLVALRDLGLGASTATSTPTAADDVKAVSAAAKTEPSTASASPTSLRSLTIRLNPDHLGPVSITMRMQAGRMDVHIAVANPQTLDLLAKDRHLLSAAVEAAGGPSQMILAAATQPPGADTAASGAAGSADRGQNDASASTGSSGGGQSRPHGRSDITPQRPSISDENPTLPHGRRSGLDGSLYL